MRINSELYQFLLDEYNFSILNEYESKEFGDASITLKSEFILLRYVRAKSKVSIDIASSHGNEVYYDLSLVKSILFNETDLRIIRNFEELNSFIRGYFNEIVNLFEPENINSTTTVLKDYENRRVKQMFPSIDKSKS